jgi:uncharacterized protein
LVRRLHDTQDAQIFLTGSSSHLLARELATSLRGRTISYEVFHCPSRNFFDFVVCNTNLIPQAPTAVWQQP